MRSPIPDYLTETIALSAGIDAGAVADYIPELANVDPDRAAIAVATIDGAVYSAGDDRHRFSIQSMSKPFTYALALGDHGIDGVAERVSVEPSGEAFNEISLEAGSGRPRNAMINAGAIATHGLVAADTREERDRRVLDTYSAYAGRELTIDEPVYRSELESAERNLGLGYLLASHGIIDDDVPGVVEGYIRQCAASVDVRDIATMAATLANGGVQPTTGERLAEPAVVRQVLSVMATCGMYDAAGDWLSNVGIPAKSGVAGGIIGVLPGQVGVAVFSPRLDDHGNSARGVHMMEQLSRDMGMHLMEAIRPARSVLREVRVQEFDGGRATVYDLRGDLIFSSTESLIRHVSESEAETEAVVFDLRAVDEIADVARRMSVEATDRLLADGRRVILVDPEHRLAEMENGERAVSVVDDLGDVRLG